MIDLAKLLLRLIYYQSRLLGVLNIEIDLRTGRARSTWFAMVQAMVVHISIAMNLLYIFWSGDWSRIWQKYPDIHQYCFLVIILMRVFLLYFVLLTRSWNRHCVVRLINGYRRLARRRPQVVHLWRRGVICKCLSIAVMQLMQFIVVIYLICIVNFPIVPGLVLCLFATTFVDLISFQLYFAYLNALIYHKFLNQELRQLLEEMMVLESLLTRPATLMIKCCSLADRLDAIAEEQCQLQALVDDLTGIFGPQSLCAVCNYYMYMVTMVFHTYSLFRYNECCERLITKIALNLSNVICLVFDIYITSNLAYTVLDQHSEMANLLAGCSTLALQLDERLEEVYESFVLQLAYNPLRLPVLSAFNIDRRNTIIILSSVIAHSIVMVEYDLRNVKPN